MPTGNINAGPVILEIPKAVQISAGVLLLIPYSVKDTNDICKVFLTIKGADNYWDAKFLKDPTSKKPYFSILIPKFVVEGNFDFEYSFANCSGTVTRVFSTSVEVAPVEKCGISFSGTVGITIRSVDFGDKAGIVTIKYNMYSITDRLDISYNGFWVASTGNLFDQNTIIPNCSGDKNGFVSGHGQVQFYYDPKKSRTADIYISGCESGTKWDIEIKCPEDLVLVGIHSSVGSESILQNVWDRGHAWVTITDAEKTSNLGLWPDWHKDVISANRGDKNKTDVQKDFFNGTGIYDRYKYITRSDLTLALEYASDHKDWSLYYNCSTFAEKFWRIATKDVLNNKESITGGLIESPRVLGNSIQIFEATPKQNTGYMRPKDVKKLDAKLNSFE